MSFHLSRHLLKAYTHPYFRAIWIFLILSCSLFHNQSTSCWFYLQNIDRIRLLFTTVCPLTPSSLPNHHYLSPASQQLTPNLASSNRSCPHTIYSAHGVQMMLLRHEITLRVKAFLTMDYNALLAFSFLTSFSTNLLFSSLVYSAS